MYRKEKNMYAVRKGRKPGVYATWEECKAQVIGVNGAEYRKFKSENEAKAYVEGVNIQGKFVYAVKNTNSIFKTWEECKEHVLGMSNAQYKKFRTEGEARDWLMGYEEAKMGIANLSLPTVYIDGSHQDGKIGFGVVTLINGIETTFTGQTTGGMNNITGELGALVFALHILKKKGIKIANIVYDYEGVYKWLSGDFKCRKDEVKEYKKFVQDFIDENDIKLYFYKCKSHSGNVLNNRADKAAKQALIDGKFYDKHVLYNKDLVL